MKDLLDSVILWEMIFLFWMAATLGNKVFGFISPDTQLPTINQIIPPAPADQ